MYLPAQSLSTAVTPPITGCPKAIQKWCASCACMYEHVESGMNAVSSHKQFQALQSAGKYNRLHKLLHPASPFRRQAMYDGNWTLIRGKSSCDAPARPSSPPLAVAGVIMAAKCTTRSDPFLSYKRTHAGQSLLLALSEDPECKSVGVESRTLMMRPRNRHPFWPCRRKIVV